MANNEEWYNNILGSGSNIFGAGASGNTDALTKMGLLAPDAKANAQSQSLMKGLLGAGLSYMSQPRNKGYGSALPYLGKALQQGMTSAQQPFDQLNKESLQNLQMQKYGAEINKLNSEAKAATAGNGLGISKLNPKDFTAPSWAQYVVTGDTRLLDGKTAEVRAKIAETNAKLKYDYGVESNTPTQQTQGQNGPQQPVQSEEGFRMGNNNIPNHPNNITLPSTGDVVTPTMYKLNLPQKTRLHLQNEAPQVLGQHRGNIDAIREQRNLIREFLNNGGANNVTGIWNRQDWSDMPESDVSNSKAMLHTITQKEFLNNYKAVKATGGGFGALSEREGERLESMGFNLNDMQSEDAIIAQLKKMDDSLGRTEGRLEEKYLMDYGQMEGGDMLPLTDYAQPKTRQLGNTGIRVPNKQADQDLLNKYR